jgi:hypothetical protein
VSVVRRAIAVIVFGLGLIGAAALAVAPAAGAQSGSLTFDPPTVVAGGGKLFINGSCDLNANAILFSHAFADQPDVGDFAGVPALPIFRTSDTGTFGIGLTIAPTVKAGHYDVSLRCGDGLAASGTLTVRSGSLPPTGAPLAEFAAVGTAVVAAGLALAVLGRHRAAA